MSHLSLVQPPRPLERHELLDLIRWLINTVSNLSTDSSKDGDCFCGHCRYPDRQYERGATAHDKYCLFIRELLEQAQRAVVAP